MHRNGLILLIILLCLAFFVSCAKENKQDPAEMGELVKNVETEGIHPFGFALSFKSVHIKRKALTDIG